MSDEKKEYPHFFKNSPTLDEGPLIKHIKKLRKQDERKVISDALKFGRATSKENKITPREIGEMSFDLLFK